jgi:group I intron endonuclease
MCYHCGFGGSIMYGKAGVYKITNKITGKVYIGSSSNLGNRKSEHFCKKSNGNPGLRKDLKISSKGDFKFEVLEFCKAEHCIAVEQTYINYYKRLFGWNMLYNESPTAGSNLGAKLGPLSEETRQKLSLAHKGKQAGELNPMFGRCGSLNPMFGRKREDLTRRNRENKGKYVGDKSPRYDPILHHFQHKDGTKEYLTKNQLYKKYALDPSSVTKMINTPGKTHKGWWLAYGPIQQMKLLSLDLSTVSSGWAVSENKDLLLTEEELAQIRRESRENRKIMKRIIREMQYLPPEHWCIRCK